jgi:hypothetical protein
MMNDDFVFYKLEWKHKKIFITHQVLLFLSIFVIIFIAINQTNPVIESNADKMELTIGGITGFIIIILAFTNRLKKLFKIKFIAFLIIWVLLYSLSAVMATLIWGIGAALIPLMIDDLIMTPYWNRIWYNEYE